MARKAVDLQMQKEAKQKKLLLLLVPVFLGLLVWQGPKTYHAFSGGTSTPPAPAASTPTTTLPTPPSPTSTTASGGLADTDTPLDPLDGQLVSFSRFDGVDPFRPKGSKPGAPQDTAQPPAATQGALLEVNGQSENVSVGASFPAADKTFILRSVRDQTVEIGLVSGGSFGDGKAVQTLSVGESVTLVAQPDGATYTIKLISVAAG
jgi:hypothetical protein